MSVITLPQSIVECQESWDSPQVHLRSCSTGADDCCGVHFHPCDDATHARQTNNSSVTRTKHQFVKLRFETHVLFVEAIVRCRDVEVSARQGMPKMYDEAGKR